MSFTLPLLSVLAIATAENTINLQRWQYCAGCRAAVESFSARVFPIINEAIEVRGETASMDLEPYTEGICQTPSFQHYKEFVEHGCVNLMQSSKDMFLAAFSGEDLHEQAQKTNPGKGNFYKMSKEICTSAMACPLSYFKSPAPLDKRTKCDACSDIGDQMEWMKMILFNPDQNRAIVQSVCNSLGYNYSPFAWMEEHCDDIMEDYDAGVLRILDKFNRDPETAIPEEFCELLKCKYNDEEPTGVQPAEL